MISSTKPSSPPSESTSKSEPSNKEEASSNYKCGTLPDKKSLKPSSQLTTKELRESCSSLIYATLRASLMLRIGSVKQKSSVMEGLSRCWLEIKAIWLQNEWLEEMRPKTLQIAREWLISKLQLRQTPMLRLCSKTFQGRWSKDLPSNTLRNTRPPRLIWCQWGQLTIRWVVRQLAVDNFTLIYLLVHLSRNISIFWSSSQNHFI